MGKKKGRCAGGGASSFNAKAKQKRAQKEDEFVDDSGNGWGPFEDTSHEYFRNRREQSYSGRSRASASYGRSHGQHTHSRQRRTGVDDDVNSLLEGLASLTDVQGHGYCNKERYCSECAQRASIYLLCARFYDEQRTETWASSCDGTFKISIIAALILALPYYFALSMDGRFVRGLCIVGFHMVASAGAGALFYGFVSRHFLHTVYSTERAQNAHDRLSSLISFRTWLDDMYRTWHVDDALASLPLLMIGGMIAEALSLLLFILSLSSTILPLGWRMVKLVAFLPFRVAFRSVAILGPVVLPLGWRTVKLIAFLPFRVAFRSVAVLGQVGKRASEWLILGARGALHSYHIAMSGAAKFASLLTELSQAFATIRPGPNMQRLLAFLAAACIVITILYHVFSHIRGLIPVGSDDQTTQSSGIASGTIDASDIDTYPQSASRPPKQAPLVSTGGSSLAEHTPPVDISQLNGPSVNAAQSQGTKRRRRKR